MNTERQKRQALWIIGALAAALAALLVILFRTEKRMTRLLARIESRLTPRSKNAPFRVDF